MNNSPIQEIHESHSNKRLIFPLFFIVFLDMLGIGIAIPILAPLLLNPFTGLLPFDTSFSSRTLFLGFLIAAYPLAQFFGAPVLGALSDRYGRKKLLFISILGTFIGYVFFAFGILKGELWLLFLSRALDGFTGGNISVALSAIADLSDEKSKAKNFGLLGMAFGFGFIIGPYIGGKLADASLVSWFNFATPFWFASLLALLNIFLIVFVFRETHHTRLQTEISFLKGIKNIQRAWQLPDLRIMFFVVFLLTFGFNFFTQFFQVFLIEKFSFNHSQIGDLFAYIGLWIALTQGVIVRPLAKRFKPFHILSFSALFLAVSLLLILLPSKALTLLFILPLVAVFQGLTHPHALAIISNLSQKENQGEILGINQSIQSLGQAIPPLIAGFAVSFHISLPILIASISTLLAWSIFISSFPAEGEKGRENNEQDKAV